MIGHRFPIGTRYRPARRHAQVCTVVDQLTTTNAAGEVVARRYVTEHEFCGCIVRESDVVDTTIARGLTPEFQHLVPGLAP